MLPGVEIFNFLFLTTLRFEIKTWFRKSAKIDQKPGINFDELPCIIPKLIFALPLFLSSFISLTLVGAEKLTILHCFQRF